MAETTEQRYENMFAVGDHADVTLRNVRGGIEISGWNEPRVSVVAVKRLGTEWGARESFDATDIEMTQDGPHVRIRTRRQGEGGIFGWMGIGRTPPAVFYTIKVPVTSDISVRTVNGPLNVTDIIGTAYLRTVEGDITMNRMSGQIIASGVDAAIRGNQIGGTVGAKTVSGSIRLTQSQLSSFWLKAVSGDATIETPLDPSGTYHVGSVDGSFHLSVPAGSRASAEMASVSGGVSCALPHTVTEMRLGHWKAQVNGGGASVSLKTVSGSLVFDVATNLSATPPPTPPPSGTPVAASRDWPEMAILKAVEKGEISVEAAIARLADLDKGA